VKTVSVIYEIVRLFHTLGLASDVLFAADAMRTPKPDGAGKFAAACNPSSFMAATYVLLQPPKMHCV
jgi:hypothetical protein